MSVTTENSNRSIPQESSSTVFYSSSSSDEGIKRANIKSRRTSIALAIVMGVLGTLAVGSMTIIAFSGLPVSRELGLGEKILLIGGGALISLLCCLSINRIVTVCIKKCNTPKTDE